VIAGIAKKIAERAANVERLIVAIAGPPGSGKSTFARAMRRQLGDISVVVPLDGFHLDNSLLRQMNLLQHKGAPETFDVKGLTQLLARLERETSPVYFPIFDRKADLSRAGAGAVLPHHKIILVEGNYLLLDRADWAAMREHFQMRIKLEVPVDVLEQRLVTRWTRLGLSRQQVVQKVTRNDLANARLVIEHSLAADFVVAN